MAGLGVLVGLAGGLIQLGQTVSTRSGSADTLTISAGNVAVTRGDYAIPVDAPFDKFPTNLVDDPDVPNVKSCSEEQHQWLRQHGMPFVTTLFVSMRNIADSGGITVRDFRTNGEVKSPRTPLVAVRCMIPIGGAVLSQAGLLRPDNRSVAVWSDVEQIKGQGQVFDGGSPVVYDLAASESAQFQLTIQTEGDFLGSVEAKVLAGDEESTVKLDIDSQDEADGADRIFLPNLNRDFDIGIGSGPGYEAEPGRPFYVDGTRYTVAELQDRLKELVR
ncbi:hypothetical protein AAE021_08215 [Arthrobacter citreus]|uniref:Flp pilus assembly protein CpaB n=1 Tax=Arthrobacter citreus TaxID=1670 RepID=A0ABZ2ZZF4_9MICC